MSVRVLSTDSGSIACMYDPVTMTAFGPIFDDESIPDMDGRGACCTFIESCTDRDPRDMTNVRLRAEVAELCKRWWDAHEAETEVK